MWGNLENCFACGQENPDGLKLSFSYEDNFSRASFCLDEKFQGYPGIAHGGIVATLIDEAMVHVLMREGLFAVTARLKLKFHQPVPLNKELVVEGRLKDTNPAKGLNYLEALIKDGKEVLARGEGVFVQQDEVVAGQ